RKLLLVLIGLFAVITLVLTAFVAWNMNSNLTAESHNKGKAIAESIAGASVELLVNRDPATVQAMVDDRRESIPGVSYVFVVDDSNEIVAHTFAPIIPDRIKALRGDPQQTVIQNVAIEGLGDCMDVCSPILAGQSGFVHVGMDRGIIREKIYSAIF